MMAALGTALGIGLSVAYFAALSFTAHAAGRSPAAARQLVTVGGIAIYLLLLALAVAAGWLEWPGGISDV